MELGNLSRSTQVIIRNELSILQKRLQAREDDYRIAAAEAILSGDDAGAEVLLVPIKELTTVRKALSAPQPMQPIANPIQPAESTPPPIAWKRHGLGVTLARQRIQGWNDASTFADAVQRIGCEKVAALKLTLNYLPLVGKELRRLPHQHYCMQVEKRDAWYIVTHCSTARKMELLNTIKFRLGIDLTAETVRPASYMNS